MSESAGKRRRAGIPSEISAKNVVSRRVMDSMASKLYKQYRQQFNADQLETALGLAIALSKMLQIFAHRNVTLPKLALQLGQPKSTHAASLSEMIEQEVEDIKEELAEARPVRRARSTSEKEEEGVPEKELPSETASVSESEEMTCAQLDIRHFAKARDGSVYVLNRKTDGSTVRQKQDTFADLSGMAKEKDDMNRNFIYPFIYPRLFRNPKSILFYGPPGTGKTALVRAAVGEIRKNNVDVVLVLASGASMKGKYVGETEKQIKLHFDCAERELEGKAGVAIIFIDELDSIAAQRTDDPTLSTSVNALIAEMDGFQQRENVVVIGATNRPWALDSAVLRRFSRRILVDLSSDETRRDIIHKGLARYFSTTTWKAKVERTITAKQHKAFYKQFSGFQQKLAKYRIPLKKTASIVDDMINVIVFKTGPHVKATPSLCNEFTRETRPRATIGNIRVMANKKESGDDQLPYCYLELMDRQPNPLATSTFGYSNSDMSKLIDAVTQQMATRVLRSCVHIHKCSKTECEVSIIGPRDMPGCKCVLLPVTMKSCNLTDAQKRMLTTYNLVWEDWEQALQDVPSSIETSIYLDTIRYTIAQ